MEQTVYPAIVRLDVKLRDGDFWVITSEDLPGLLLCGKDWKQLFSDVPPAIETLFELNYGLKVQASPLVTPREMDHPIHYGALRWVAYPTHKT